MSQTPEELLRSFFVRCSDVGLKCDYVIFGTSEEKIMDTMIIHMYECHAINPQEMTTCMRLKIKENIQLYRYAYYSLQYTLFRIGKIRPSIKWYISHRSLREES
jgi:predicted small metal-binding protein